jgi:nucleoid DNA-binding protein
MTTAKRDLVVKISEKTGLAQPVVLAVVEEALNEVTSAIGNGDKVKLRGFGVFKVCWRKSRFGRIPSRPGTLIPIPSFAVVKFKAGKEMLAALRALTKRLDA